MCGHAYLGIAVRFDDMCVAAMDTIVMRTEEPRVCQMLPFDDNAGIVLQTRCSLVLPDKSEQLKDVWGSLPA